MIAFEKELNRQQYDAVVATDGPVLVLAGAGTGKTRVITYKIAYLIQQKRMQPWRIMAVTFTNKAAEEMKQRLASLVGMAAHDVWMGTFHAIALRILRKDGEKIGLKKGFAVVDQDDRMAIIRAALKALGVDPKKHSPKQYLHHISSFKNTLEFIKGDTPGDTIARLDDVFDEYQDALMRQNMIDFDDMLSLCIRLFTLHKDVRDEYRGRFDYLLVDEYQDTNAVQFHFLQLISGETGNISVVGDDDQSIYGWRGADIRNILEFDRHFKNVSIVKLTENYRSTPDILETANKLIKNNRKRRGKDLVAVINAPGSITRWELADEVGEADFVVNKIDELIQQGVAKNDIAILYRTNAQSRNFEVALNQRRMRYKIIGSIGFYQRREIKDMLAYLRLFANPFDRVSFTRAIKNPGRGIGDASIDKVINAAIDAGGSLLEGARIFAESASQRQRGAMVSFLQLFARLETAKDVVDMIDMIVEDTRYEEWLRGNEAADEVKVRMENVGELKSAAVAFLESTPEDAATLDEFLASTSLQTSSDEDAGDVLRLMTIHAAKGLEFDTVFLTGMEDGLFPLASSLDNDDGIEEERRLCYVGITRAKKRLFLTHVRTRLMYGKRQPGFTSQFLDEMGSSAKQGAPEKKPGIGRPVPGRAAYNREAAGKAAAAYAGKKETTDGKGGIRDGGKVWHKNFGEGIVISVTGNGDSAKVDVFFKAAGLKKIVAKFLSLNPLEDA